MGFRDTLFSLIIAFLVVDTLTVGLRVVVRTRITRSFKYDDIGMLAAYVGLVIYSGLVLAAMHYGDGEYNIQSWHDLLKGEQLDYGLEIVCFITSGFVKVAVALALYRISTNQIIRKILIGDIAISITWIIATSLITALGCKTLSPWNFSHNICYHTDISRQVCHIIFDFFHALLPIAILWNVKISPWIKLSIVSLFMVGLFAAVATIVKLICIIRAWDQVGPVAVSDDLWAELEIWTVTEHGSSVFACSVLALRPLFQNAAKGLSIFSVSYGSNNTSKDNDTRSSNSVNGNSPSFDLPAQNEQAASSDSLNTVSKFGACSKGLNCIIETKSIASGKSFNMT